MDVKVLNGNIYVLVDTTSNSGGIGQHDVYTIVFREDGSYKSALRAFGGGSFDLDKEDFYGAALVPINNSRMMAVATAYDVRPGRSHPLGLRRGQSPQWTDRRFRQRRGQTWLDARRRCERFVLLQAARRALLTRSPAQLRGEPESQGLRDRVHLRDVERFVLRETAGYSDTTGPYDFAGAIDASPELPRLNGDYIRNYFGTNARYLLAKLARPQGVVYASIAFAEGTHGNFAFVRVVETKDMDTGKITLVGAEQMQKALADNGRISLYGIQFDFDKDVVKSESKLTLDEIAKVLRADPELRLGVVGHTDAKGGADYNIDLSKRRAANVASALTRDYAINASRLTPRGAGASELLASSGSEEGRAKNRRVELVRQ